MKKLMIAAATAAMIGGAFAACSEETTCGQCLAWDLSLKLKTLTPKALNCKGCYGEDCEYSCDENWKAYYLDQTTRTLKGYLWACDYDCEDADAMNIVLWEPKTKKSIISLPLDDDYQTVDAAFADLKIYGKKANKVWADWEFTGEDAEGYTAIDVRAIAMGGTVAKLGNSKCGECTPYVKSLSGYAVGTMLVETPTDVEYIYEKECVEQIVKYNGLCDDCVETKWVCKKVLSDVNYIDYDILTLTLCDYCCFENWCTDGEALDEFEVPAYGTWSMKYNKKVANGEKSMRQLVPDYAL